MYCTAMYRPKHLDLFAFREAFFWRDADSLRRFLAAGLRVNKGLAEAVR